MPFIVHESAMARMERVVKRLWVVIIILILLFVGTNAAWLYYESQMETYTETITQTNEDGVNNYIGNDGDIFNGETKICDPDYYTDGPEA